MTAYDRNVDPSQTAASKNYAGFHSSTCDCPCCYIVGPGGKTTNIENDEKGMLDSIPLRLAQGIRGESLPSNHDSFAEGIYATHSFASTEGMRD
jgi:hypothetical protein